VVVGFAPYRDRLQPCGTAGRDQENSRQKSIMAMIRLESGPAPEFVHPALTLTHDLRTSDRARTGVERRALLTRLRNIKE